MRKTTPDQIELTEEELSFELIELASDGVDSLARAFNMISDLCSDLQREIQATPLEVPENQIN
jgi:hypothetical protein